MKTLTENYMTGLEDIKRHSLAGLCAISGDLQAAMLIASRENDVLYVSELSEGVSECGHERLKDFSAEVFTSAEITDEIKSLFCLALCDRGSLWAITEFAGSRPELWDFVLDNLPGREDQDIYQFAMVTGNNEVVRQCVDHFTGSSYPSTLLIEKLIQRYPKIHLSQKQKNRLIRAAISGDLKPDEVEACEKLAGRKLTELERKRYLKNRFRDCIEMDCPMTALEWVWKYQDRRLTRHERLLLRSDAKKTILARQKK